MELFYEKGILKYQPVGWQKINPIWIDLVSWWRHHEKTFNKRSVYQEPLARALGIKRTLHRPKIFDATCGRGKDALLFVFWGCEVLSAEKSSLVYQLLQDGIERAKKSGLDLSRWELIVGDSQKLLPQEVKKEFDVIYLDPMYDQISKRKPKKEMELLRLLDTDKDNDGSALFKRLRIYASSRVVIKRPLKAPFLVDQPDVSYKGRSTRYDVYLTKKGSR